MVYSVAPVAAGVINVRVRTDELGSGFLRAANTTATASGLCGTTNASLAVIVNRTPDVTTVSPGRYCSASSTNIAPLQAM